MLKLNYFITICYVFLSLSQGWEDTMLSRYINKWKKHSTWIASIKNPDITPNIIFAKCHTYFSIGKKTNIKLSMLLFETHSFSRTLEAIRHWPYFRDQKEKVTRKTYEKCHYLYENVKRSTISGSFFFHYMS